MDDTIGESKLEKCFRVKNTLFSISRDQDQHFDFDVVSVTQLG